MNSCINHDFLIVNADTDSISFCKSDKSSISEIERKALVQEINKLSPEFMIWSDDGMYKTLICLAAKNYIMEKFPEDLKPNEKPVKLKGSSIKDSKIEPIVKEFNKCFIDSLLNEKNDFLDIYTKFVLLVDKITDIKAWCSKKTISAKTYASKRENEAKIIRAIQGTDYREGDKVYVFFDENNELVLLENFKGTYSKEKFYTKLYQATKKFKAVVDRGQFLKYALVKNQNALRFLQGLPPIIKEPKKKKKSCQESNKIEKSTN